MIPVKFDLIWFDKIWLDWIGLDWIGLDLNIAFFEGQLLLRVSWNYAYSPFKNNNFRYLMLETQILQYVHQQKILESSKIKLVFFSTFFLISHRNLIPKRYLIVITFCFKFLFSFLTFLSLDVSQLPIFCIYIIIQGGQNVRIVRIFYFVTLKLYGMYGFFFKLYGLYGFLSWKYTVFF